MLFISHRTTDKQAAEDLKRRALSRGYDNKQLFLDSDPDAGIAAGEDWEHILYERLKQCQALIVVCSPRWTQSYWCFAELVVAKTLGKLVFPVVIEDCPLDAVVGERQAVFVYRESEAAYERLWNSLENHGLGPHAHRPWPPDAGDPCPYPGLFAFSERFSPVYFGRDRETAEVLESLNTMRDRGEPRLLLIHGGSGSGKSSLLRAGVLPRLDRTRDWHVLPTLRYGQAPNDDLTLLALLARELAASFPREAPTRPDWKDLRAKFESDNFEHAARDFFETTQDLILALGCRDATTLLPIDQFEELLTAVARPSAERFLRFLQALLGRNNGRLLVTGTLRSDFLDVYERYPHALQPPHLRTYRLPPFPWERVTDVIVQPAARVGVTFTTELLERLKLDAPTVDALPLLAFTLEKLFRECAADGRIGLREYESLGGMTGAIEQAVKKIVPPNLPLQTEQALRMSFVRHLVQVNEKDEFVRRSAVWSEFEKAELAKAIPLLEQFVDQRILHTSAEGLTTTIEVSHEALFRCWPQLVNWLADSRRILQWRRSVERDRLTYGAKWSGLTRSQLATAREWPEQRAKDLFPNEIAWIKSARLNATASWAALIAAAFLLAVLAVFAGWQWWRAEQEVKRTLAQARETYRQLAWSNWNLGIIARDEENPAKGAHLLMRAYQYARLAGEDAKGDSELAERAELVGVQLLSQGRLWELIELGDGVASATLDKKNRLLSWSADGMVRVWDVSANKVVAEHQHPGAVTGASWDKEDNRVLSWSFDGTVRVWDVSGNNLVAEHQHPSSVNGASWDEKSKRVLSSSSDGTVRVWDVSANKVVAEHKHPDAVTGASWEKEENRVLSWSFDGTVRVWDVSANKVVAEHQHPSSVNGALWDEKCKRVLSSSFDGTVRVWDVSANKVVAEHKHPDAVTGASWDKENNRVLSWSIDGTVRVWDVKGNQIISHHQHPSEVRGAWWHKDGNRVLSWSLGTVRLWDVKSNRMVTERREGLWGFWWDKEENRLLSWIGDVVRVWDVRGNYLLAEHHHPATVNGALWNKEENRVLSWSQDGTVRVWDVNGNYMRFQDQHPGSVMGASWDNEEMRILSWSQGGTVRIWDVSGDETLTEHKHPDPVTGALWDKEENRVLSWSLDGTVRVWDVNGNTLVATHKHPGAVRGASWNKEETRVLSWSEDGTVRVCDVGRNSIVAEHRHAHWAVGGFWHRGTHVLSWGWDGRVRIWDVDNDKMVAEHQHPGAVNGASWDIWENRVMSWSQDGTVRVWDVNSNRIVIEYAHADQLGGASWDKSGKRIVSWSGDGVRVWDVSANTALARPDGAMAGASWDKEGRRILCWGWDGTVGVWDVNGNTLVARHKHPGTVTGASWDKEENRVLSWSFDGTVRVWDVRGNNLVVEHKHLDEVMGTSWDNDARRVLSWSRDGLVRVWDISANRVIAEYPHANAVSWGQEGVIHFITAPWLGASWDKYGKRVLSWSPGGTVRVFDVSVNKIIAGYHNDRLLGANGASWDREGNRILFWSGDGSVRILDLRVSSVWVTLRPGTPKGELATQVEAHTGLRLDEASRLVPLSRQEWLQSKQRFAELQAQTSL